MSAALKTRLTLLFASLLFSAALPVAQAEDTIQVPDMRDPAPETEDSPSGPSDGEYLDIVSRIVYQYDSASNTLTEKGETTYEAVCANGPSSSATQCGDCVYVPQGTWQTLATYTYGACASIDATNVNDVIIRIDVRALRDSGQDWWTEAHASYYKWNADGGLDLLSTIPLPRAATECVESAVVQCEIEPFPSPLRQDGPADADLVVATALIHADKDPDTAPVRAAVVSVPL